jgi:hypothetical protein
MNDAAHVCCGETTCDLRRNCCSPAWHQGPYAPKHRGKVFSIDKLHHDGRRFTLWSNIEHSGDVRMRDNCGGTTFGAETIGCSGRRCKRCAKDLDGDVSPERLIGSAENEGSRPFANQLL